ncbi:GIY-YIG nuclease family protein [Neptuniibacter sp. QD37_6]|uniref:GIY-YIG nuclease family protein n=1 Tax=Neptuniibacter sp. QD37_6 TaxID=3398210 RepID=UPI0039F4AD1C
MNKLKGWIYVISNESLQDIVKVGTTDRDPSIRAKELGSTGLPHPYTVQYELLTYDPKLVEKEAHKLLKEFNAGKEWFKCSIDSAIEAIKKASGNQALFAMRNGIPCNTQNISNINDIVLNALNEMKEHQIPEPEETPQTRELTHPSSQDEQKDIYTRSLWEKDNPTPKNSTPTDEGYVRCNSCSAEYWPTFKHKCKNI